MAEKEISMMLPNNSCFSMKTSNPNNIWKSGNIFEDEVPTLSLQIAFHIFAHNMFYCILEPLHQSRLVAEILAGCTMSLIFSIHPQLSTMYLPTKGILPVETFTHMGIMFYAFLRGLELNLDNIVQIRRKAISIAIVGIILPMLIGMGFFALIHVFYKEPLEFLGMHKNQKINTARAYLFWSLPLTITGFPVLARILADLKLLYTSLGRSSLTAAMISDIYGWGLFIILIPFASNDVRAIYTVFATIVFIVFCIFVLRPFLTQYIDQHVDNNDHDHSWDNSELMFVLMGAFVCSYITDALGTHAIVGAFVYGLILPHGRLADLILEKVDDFVSGAIASLYVFRAALTVNLVAVAQLKSWPLMVFTIFILSIPKVVSTLVATFFFGMTPGDGVGIGLLLNSKSVLALIILNFAWDRKILSVVTYTIMVLAILVMTILVPLLINFIYKPRTQYEKYRLRTMEKLRLDSELRILACVHDSRQAASVVSALKSCNATRISPLHVFGAHLIELTGHATALFATHMEQSPVSFAEPQNPNQPHVKIDSVSNIFNSLSEANNAIRVETLNAVSAYETIHEDIYSLAEQKRTSLILIPFHKQPDAEGSLILINETYKHINLNVLQNPPCSVAIFIDRGLGSFSKPNMRILMPFVGGPDDREALAFAWRVARNLGNQLSMVRIILSGDAAKVADSSGSGQGENQWISSSTVDSESEKLLDNEFVNSFRFKAVYDNDSITYSEEEVRSSEELTMLLHELDKEEYDLYIVGQGCGKNSEVFLKFLEWSDNPELGVIGDIVASKSFGSKSSLLVLQQYGSVGMAFRVNQNQQPTEFQTTSDGSDSLMKLHV